MDTGGSLREGGNRPILCWRRRARRTQYYVLNALPDCSGPWAGCCVAHARASIRMNLQKEVLKAREILLAKGVDKRFCRFGPKGEPVPERIWAPAQAMSKFQMEQALGDWAEERVATAINRSTDCKAIAFGDNDKTLSQEESFAALYRAGKVRELEFGKRSDLLLFKRTTETPKEATVLSGEEAEVLCRSCEAALEVRSSRTSAHRYIDYCKKQKELGKRPARMEPSYTVKVEDLSKVYRWMARNKKPLIYVQVFFDSIYALNFTEVFRFINSKGEKLTLENPSRSGKFTIMIPLSLGRQIGTVTPPDFEVVHTMHDNGRHDIYARPLGGDAVIDLKELLAVI